MNGGIRLKRIIVDAFGGDHAPLEVLRGCELAVREFNPNYNPKDQPVQEDVFDLRIILIGDEDYLRSLAHKEQISLAGMDIVHTESIMPMEADPVEILKKYDNCSMARGFKLLAEGGGDAFVTAGSTGAAVVGATFLLKRMRGIKRAAIATVIPHATGAFLLLDAGANNECRPEMLLQFGMMGSIYMNKVMGIENPRVGLVNIGVEANKGTSLQVNARQLLENAPLNFIGNVEARQVPLGACDVAVTDGFTGNVMLKLIEGMAKFFSGEIKGMLKSNPLTMLGSLTLMGGMKRFKSKLDYTEYGGAPLLGFRGTVIKAHGSSNAKAIKNAIGQAIKCCDNNIIAEIEQAIEQYKDYTAKAKKAVAAQGGSGDAPEEE